MGKGMGLAAGCLVLVLLQSSVSAETTLQLRLLHVSDTHGKLVPHWEKFSDGKWHRDSGGFAKIATRVKQLRATAPGRSLLLVNGDNFHGGAELLFTRGRAAVPILNALGIDAYSPGNWDFADGPEEFRARFVGTRQQPRLVRFPVLAAGVYNAEGAPAGAIPGKPVLPDRYLIRELDGIKVALIGLNDDKPAEQAEVYTVGMELRAGWTELPGLLTEVRRQGADLVVVMSEAGLAQNLAVARDVPGIHVLLSADTHEVTRSAVRIPTTGTLVVESGQGSRVGQLDLTVVKNGRRLSIRQHRWVLHELDEQTPEDADLKQIVAEVRAPFLKGAAFRPVVRQPPGWKPGTGLWLRQPIDTVLGHADFELHRWQLFDSPGDNAIADALRELTGADIAATNGFRFDIGIPAGSPITLADIYHWMPLGAHVAVGEVTGGQLLERLEQFLSSVLDPVPYRRGGGWVPRVSGIRFHVDLTGPHGPAGDRIRRAEVWNRKSKRFEPLVEDRIYRLASCHTPGDPMDRMCRTHGVRNLRFLTSDLKLVRPLIQHQPPNPQPKLQAAPPNVMFLAQLLQEYLRRQGGRLRGSAHAEARWVIDRRRQRDSKLVHGTLQPLRGEGPAWLAGSPVE